MVGCRYGEGFGVHGAQSCATVWPRKGLVVV